jgi:carboxylate-amine ligase
VEEEFLLVDAITGAPAAASCAVLAQYADLAADPAGPRLTAELQQEMLEVISPPHRTLPGLQADVVAGRALADRAARAAGVRAVALATSPLPVCPHVHPDPRYDTITARYGTPARDLLVCGLHVHVSVASAEEGVAVLDRIRHWLPVLVALSANSPFAGGQDTGYASYRSHAWQAWPTAGPCPVHGSVAAYRALEAELMATGVLLDEAMLYFDARLSRTHPTVEVRVADVCLYPGDTGLIAGLVRALVETAAREAHAGVPPALTTAAALRLASWRAALSGLCGELVHPATGRPAAAWDVVAALLDHVFPALVKAGDDEAVIHGLGQLLDRGTGADRQRAVHRRTGRMSEVVLDALDATHDPGTGRTGVITLDSAGA